MTDNEIQILIVDDQREEARFMKTSLELLEQGFYITDVLSGEEALLELSRSFDLVVSKYRLPGMTGLDLIKRVKKRLPEAKTLLTVDSDPDEIREAANGLGVYSILEKPLEASDFTKAVQHALFGEKEEDIPVSEVESEFGVIPDVDAEAIGKILAPHMLGLGAMAIAFVNRKGEVLWRGGQFDDRLRFSELVVFLARNLTNSGTIADYIGQVPSIGLHYYDGTLYDIFSISVGVHFFVALVYTGDSQSALGSVMRFRARVIRDVIDYIGVDAVLDRVAGAASREHLASVVDEAPASAPSAKPTKTKDKESVVPQPAEETPVPVAVFEFSDEDEADPLDLDLDSISDVFGDAPSENGNDLDDLDSFWEAAAGEAGRIREDVISMDEAIELGLWEDFEEEV